MNQKPHARLESGPIYEFSDWPVNEVPRIAAGVYTVWHNDALLFVGMAGRGMTEADIEERRSETPQRPTGLYSRLASHASGRRSGDQFCVYVCDRFVIPELGKTNIEMLSRGELSLDRRTREWIRDKLQFRFVETEDGRSAGGLEREVQCGCLSCGPPLLNGRVSTAGNASSGPRLLGNLTDEPTKIVRLEIDKTGFLNLKDIHRKFFFLAGHMFNELVVLRRFLLYTEKREDSSILRDARATWSLVVLRLLAGKLWESWSMTKKLYHQPGIGDSPWLKDNQSIAAPLGKIKRYFSHQNVINTIRNDFGFHYSLPDADLSNYGPDDNIDFLMGDSFGNTIYYSSEVMVTSDLFDSFPDLPPDESFDRIVKEIARQSRLMLVFLNNYIGATCEYLAENQGGRGHVTEEVSVENPKTLDEAKIEIVIEDV